MKDSPAFFYIIYSPSLDRFYSGITSKDFKLRLEKHNFAAYGKHFTSQASDWEERLVLSFNSYSLARKAELYVKQMKSRKFIEKLINNKSEQLIFISKIMSI